MNTLRDALTWLGGFSAVAYIAVGIWFTTVNIRAGRRLEAERAQLRARRTRITEQEIAAVDLDTEIAELLKEDTK